MRRALGLSLLLAAAGCQKNEATPRGTEILSWSSGHTTRATRASVAAAKEVGPRAARDVTVHVRPDRKGAVTLALHVESAPVELTGGDRTSRPTAPVAVRLTVTRNADWTLKASCNEGPTFRLPTIVAGSPVTPQAMLLGCNLHLKHEDTFNDLTYAVSLEIGGDGSVEPSILGGVVSLE